MGHPAFVVSQASWDLTARLREADYGKFERRGRYARETQHTVARACAPYRWRHYCLHGPYQSVLRPPRNSQELPTLAGGIGNPAVSLLLVVYLAANTGRMDC